MHLDPTVSDSDLWMGKDEGQQNDNTPYGFPYYSHLKKCQGMIHITEIRVSILD